MSDTIRFGARLRAARKAAGFKTSKSFTKKYKIPQSTYSQHESGTRNPEDTALKSYSKFLGVRFEWLKNGSGLPYSKLTKDDKNIFQEELLDIRPVSQKVQIEIKHQELLVKILEELLKFTQVQKRKINMHKILSDALALYHDIVTSGETTEAQIKMLTPSLNAYKRVIGK